MKFLVELNRSNSGVPLSNEAARTFMNVVMLPTLARGEQLARDGVILAGGPVAGRVALCLIVQAASAADLEAVLTSLPLWGVADTKVTPLIDFAEQRKHVLTLLQHVSPARS